MFLFDKLNSYILKTCSPVKFLTKVRLEACTLCQLNCKTCYMRIHDSGCVGKGYLSFENFKKFVDNNPKINLIELANNGEIFLNPELDKIIKYAYEKKVKLEARGGVNFNTVSDEMLELLVKYRFNHLTIAIDGTNQISYEKYRTNGKFDTVIENIRKLNLLKNKHHSKSPKLLWQYVIMESNKNEIDEAKKLAKSLNMRIKFKLDWDENNNIKKEEIENKVNINSLNRKDFENKNKKPYAISACQQLISSPQINYDGRLLGCCCNFRKDYEINVFEVGLEKALNSEQYKKAQSIILGEINDDGTTPCSNCKKYLYMKKNNQYVKFKIIKNCIKKNIFNLNHV